ncbi:hypothetical protein HDE_03674 [Halotydeus destructor]|nr:hypothetical protein HDE_03674 [Halotydeus destructor]
MIKAALYDPLYTEGKKTVVEDATRTIILNLTDNGLIIQHFISGRQVSLMVEQNELNEFRKCLNVVFTILMCRARKDEDTAVFQRDVLTVLMVTLIRKQMSIDECRGCDQQISTPLAHACLNTTRTVNGTEVSLHYHEAAEIVLAGLADISELYLNVLDLLHVERPKLIDQAQLMEAIYTLGYGVHNAAIKMKIPSSLITLFINNQ